MEGFYEKNILIIEDETRIRFLLRLFLRENFNIIEASDGDEGLIYFLIIKLT